MTSPLDLALVYNPGSGRGLGAARAADFAAEYRRRFGREVRLRPTTSAADIRVAACEMASQCETLAVMGGDGTVSEALQGLAAAAGFAPLDKPVGILPAGSGNSFLRDFGITSYPAARDALLEAVQRQVALPADLALIRYLPAEPDKPAAAPGLADSTASDASDSERRRICFNFFGVGLICEITRRATRLRRLGALNYTVAALGAILNHRPRTYRLRIEGESDAAATETVPTAADFISVSNSRYTGGAMEIAPDVRIDDGRLFLVMLQNAGRWEMLRLLRAAFRGQGLQHPKVRSQFVQRLAVEHDEPLWFNVDGELEFGRRPEIEIRPQHWRLRLPPERLE